MAGWRTSSPSLTCTKHVYSLTSHLGVSEEICSQPPSTDTYSLPQKQEEFYFALPYDQMDLLLYAFTNGVPAEQAGLVLGLIAGKPNACTTI